MLSLSYVTQKPSNPDSKLNNSKSSKSTNGNKKSHPNLSQKHENTRYLQQTLGNQEVQRMIKSGLIQAKLKISRPNDPYEREADRVAEQIMKTSISQGETSIQNNSENKIHRKCSTCEMNEKKKEELKISRKPTSSSSLETSSPNIFLILENTDSTIQLEP